MEFQKKDKIFINGSWVSASTEDTIDVTNSATEEVVATIPACNADDVDKAVSAAKDAFEQWSNLSVETRSSYLTKITEGITARSAELANTIATEVGTPLNLASLVQVGLPTMDFATMPQVLSEFSFEEKISSSLVLKEPVGVVGAITPWNYPLHQICAKVAPALAAGCTVVVKPSVVAPLNAYILTEIIQQAGLPQGVFNMVTGSGTVVGEAIVTHPSVDMVSFTGSTRAGKRIAELASRDIKRVALELGGKSACIILDDVELPRAVASGISMCFLNSGQTCVALTRMLVPRSKLTEVEELAVKEAETYTPGDPFADSTRLGPLVSAQQLLSVRGYIQKGIDEGAKLLTGGTDLPDGIEKGYFVRPTVFSEVSNDMTIAREEIFGPVLSIIPYDSEDDAVAIANDSQYGLSGAVWASDNERAIRVAKRIRTGQLDLNGAMFNPMAPFGGYKQSGYGRELGRYGLEEYLEIKSLQM